MSEKCFFREQNQKQAIIMWHTDLVTEDSKVREIYAHFESHRLDFILHLQLNSLIGLRSRQCVIRNRDTVSCTQWAHMQNRCSPTRGFCTCWPGGKTVDDSLSGPSCPVTFSGEVILTFLDKFWKVMLLTSLTSMRDLRDFATFADR